MAVCTYECRIVYSHTHVERSQVMMDHLPLSLSILYFWDRVSHWTSILPPQRGWLAGQTPMTLLASAPQCGIMDTQPHNPVLFCLLYSGGGTWREGGSFLSPRLPLNPDLLPSYSHGAGAQACVTRICFQHDYWQIFKVTSVLGLAVVSSVKEHPAGTHDKLRLIPITDCDQRLFQ